MTIARPGNIYKIDGHCRRTVLQSKCNSTEQLRLDKQFTANSVCLHTVAMRAYLTRSRVEKENWKHRQFDFFHCFAVINKAISRISSVFYSTEQRETIFQQNTSIHTMHSNSRNICHSSSALIVHSVDCS